MNEYTKYRLELAAERVIVSKEMIDSGHFRDSINRSYYAIFTAVRALLAEEEIDFKKIMRISSLLHVKRRRNNISTRSSSSRRSKFIWRAWND
ncbi:MAG: HEPN domain-containing protein [Selenomonadaceae bacterium]|nr:HEPN domain-containing protein [Selenomonadaceae bacterium]